MGLFSATERINALDRKSIAFTEGRCLHSTDKYIECDACYDICPINAIEHGKPPNFEEETCQSCLACIPVCPTGAYSSEDAVPALVKTAARHDSTTIELACEVHLNLDEGPTNSETVIKVRGCLAGIGTGGYFLLFALGKEKIISRLDSCQDCPWGKLQTQIQSQVDQTNSYLSAWDMEGRVEVIKNIEEIQMHERPVWDAQNPPLSRRDLFRFASERSKTLVARAIHPGGGDRNIRRPSPNHLRMIAAIEQLPEIQKDNLNISGFASISVSEECCACGACERVCPTKAIKFTLNNFKTFSLKLQVDHCVGCKICQHICISEAITIDQIPTFKSVFGNSELLALQGGDITRCERCNVIIAKKPNVFLCPVCEERIKNPFSAVFPDRLKQLIEIRADNEKKS
jgi:ferredoxin